VAQGEGILAPGENVEGVGMNRGQPGSSECRKLAWALALALVVFVSQGCSGQALCPACDCPELIRAQIVDDRFVESALVREGPYDVRHVADGDTIKIETGETIRLIGVDTPETKHPQIPIQRFGREASSFTKKTCYGQKVYIEYYKHSKYDKYNRLLAYVWVNGKMLNAELVSRGYAYVYRRYPCSRKAMLVSLEAKARAEQRGLWNHGLTDGRYTRLVHAFDALSPEGKAHLDKVLLELALKFPAEELPPPEYPVPDEFKQEGDAAGEEQ